VRTLLFKKSALCNYGIFLTRVVQNRWKLLIGRIVGAIICPDTSRIRVVDVMQCFHHREQYVASIVIIATNDNLSLL